ncbi:hypothetical protein PE067_14080 [Paracoccus sp. DMF-8]|uniref:hypothetical protein n=1 Tax=Paracoccus sp. DMF-8 TaxID=3019445 RepID=UPI0023E86B75|nr:hypothetical protein [Paracoccus sp. DMF-8]MDF3607164.1 hypothetical protein [Paracoccus sp. DMF-8]
MTGAEPKRADDMPGTSIIVIIMAREQARRRLPSSSCAGGAVVVVALLPDDACRRHRHRAISGQGLRHHHRHLLQGRPCRCRPLRRLLKHPRRPGRSHDQHFEGFVTIVIAAKAASRYA